MINSKEKVLVTIQLSGGNDYLNCIVPWENPIYKDSRKNIKINDEEIIPLDNKLGLNPGMGIMKKFYDEATLMGQKFVMDPSISITEYLEQSSHSLGSKVKVKKFLLKTKTFSFYCA